MADSYKLTYFNVRGLAETSRLLFALAGVDYVDERIPYTFGSQNDIPEEIKLKLPYGQVPLLELGDGQRLSQSGTIGRYLAKKFGFYGANDLEAARIDEIVDAVKDYRDQFRDVHMAKDDEAKAEANKKLMEVATPKYLGKFNEILEKNGSGFLVGKGITLADLNLFNLLTAVGPGGMGLDVTKGYPRVDEFVKKVEEIPQIKAWIAKRPKTVF